MNLSAVACLLFLLFAAKTTRSQLGVSLDGGVDNIDPADKEVQKAVKFAVSEHNKASDDTFAYKLAKIISAKGQVVSGMKYIIEAKIGRTTCKKEDLTTQNSINKCPFQRGPQNAKNYRCRFEVWSRPWIKSTQLLVNECS
ncbi:cystatin-like isoform X1 [Erpetoichthys calabaricus]|uniref:Cystatin-like n=1 Tax=Erpetoichthys calabaricus TaxID=27687 RepID=A0A8C4SZT7_ERPCA|nr:cystatin-like isoform X1 [Erpetoichthys calabaricus]